MQNHASVRDLANFAPAPKGTIRLSALFLSEDQDLILVIRDLALSMALRIDLCSDLLQATRKVATTKYQGIFVDYADELNASALINGVRGSTSNSADVVYAFVKDANQAVAARRLGANFVVPQPFTVVSLAPYIRAGYGLMIHELRRYFRAPVVFPVDLIARDGRRLPARSIDLSSGGLAVAADQTLTVGQLLEASFQVPGSSDALAVSVTVCWTDNARRAGLRFEELSPIAQSVIQRWMRTQIDTRLSLDRSGSSPENVGH